MAAWAVSAQSAIKPALQIFFDCDHLEMIWIHARPVSTGMVQVHAARDYALQRLINYPMNI